MSEETLHAPHLMDLEIAQVIRRYVLAGEMTTRRGSEAIQDLLQLPVTRYPHDVFLFRIWQLRHNMTAYDAAYVTLAEALAIPLLTLDKRLANSRGHKASIELIASG